MTIGSETQHDLVLQLDQTHSVYTFLSPYFHKTGYEPVISDLQKIFSEEPARQRLLGGRRSPQHVQHSGSDTHPAYDFKINNGVGSLEVDLGDIKRPGQLAVWSTLSFYERSVTDRGPFGIDFVDLDPDGAMSKTLGELADDPDQAKIVPYMGLKPNDPLSIRGHALSEPGIPFTALNVSKLALPDLLINLATEYRNLRPNAGDLGFTALVGVLVDLRDFRDVWQSAATAATPVEGAQLLLDGGIFQPALE